VDANLCREHLERLLGEESTLLGQLETLLDNEFRHLNSNDIDALEQAGVTRQDCTGELVRVEDERRTLCRMSGNSADLKGLEELIKWCDPHATLRARWADCAERAGRCRERNDRNGMAVAARLKRVEGMLNIITGRNHAPTTYSPQGAYAPTTAGRMIRSEA
jgi:flagellar biosynthesis/type III secretory pathway chaperone